MLIHRFNSCSQVDRVTLLLLLYSCSSRPFPTLVSLVLEERLRKGVLESHCLVISRVKLAFVRCYRRTLLLFVGSEVGSFTFVALFELLSDFFNLLDRLFVLCLQTLCNVLSILNLLELPVYLLKLCSVLAWLIVRYIGLRVL